MKPHQHQLATNIRGESIAVLNRHLAAAIDLHAQVKQAHWNVRGETFIALHELFDKIADDVEEWSDMIAERAAALGGEAEGTVQVAAASSFLPRYTLKIAACAKHAEAIAAALGAFSASLRAAIDASAAAGDAVTADLFTEIARAADKQTWFVAAHHPPH
jgi:starvation-inducible DNA-binding protein|uniref:DNA starvation/stationary phase protection protein Dps n=1 Tax=Acidicaldus sp. TaxID=1872105 RepID=A0A8J4H8D6_9PROT